MVCAAHDAAQVVLQEAKACAKGGQINQVRGQRWAMSTAGYWSWKKSLVLRDWAAEHHISRNR